MQQKGVQYEKNHLCVYCHGDADIAVIFFCRTLKYFCGRGYGKYVPYRISHLF